jgi:hypothetical protein
VASTVDCGGDQGGDPGDAHQAPVRAALLDRLPGETSEGQHHALGEDRYACGEEPHAEVRCRPGLPGPAHDQRDGDDGQTPQGHVVGKPDLEGVPGGAALLATLRPRLLLVGPKLLLAFQLRPLRLIFQVAAVLGVLAVLVPLPCLVLAVLGAVGATIPPPLLAAGRNGDALFLVGLRPPLPESG